MHCTFALAQFEQGYCLLQRTLRRRHITQERGFKAAEPCGADEPAFGELEEGVGGF